MFRWIVALRMFLIDFGDLIEHFCSSRSENFIKSLIEKPKFQEFQHPQARCALSKRSMLNGKLQQRT